MRVTFDRTKLIDDVNGSQILSLGDAKNWLRVDSNDENDLIQSLVDVAVGSVQSYIGQALDEISDFKFYLPDFYNVNLPVGPLRSIESIEYYDQGNTLRTLATNLYWTEVGNVTQPTVHFKQPLPDVYDDRAQPVIITGTVGYAANKIPPAVLHAVRLLLSQYYDIRENFAVGTIVSAEMPNGIKALLSPYRNVYFV
jgi:uncharacterized phiE125 gp8 family phage protein